MFPCSLRIRGKAGKPEQEHRKHRNLCFPNSTALALMGKGPMPHSCPSVHEISSPQVPSKTTATYSDEDTRHGKLFSLLQPTSSQRTETSRGGGKGSGFIGSP